MPLSAGTRIGPYEIVAPLGAGGMGEVYRARDSKLGREVALKVLPAALANDANYMARFQREAQALAALNHPNIAAIYGLEDRAIIMELVEGQTLDQRISAGAIPVAEALSIARQIADALEAAHEKGIVHRDLKPANVKMTPEGVVKVLDFGLATAVQHQQSSDPANSPTLTMAMTQEGIIMGTAGYMSPEQASGRLVDKRADIFSFGVLLWEMLSGRKLFEGETVSHTLAHVLTAQPDWSALPSSTTPPALPREGPQEAPSRHRRRLGNPRRAGSSRGSGHPASGCAAALVAVGNRGGVGNPHGRPRLHRLPSRFRTTATRATLAAAARKSDLRAAQPSHAISGRA
jgi:serine/threonine protein kinase